MADILSSDCIKDCCSSQKKQGKYLKNILMQLKKVWEIDQVTCFMISDISYLQNEVITATNTISMESTFSFLHHSPCTAKKSQLGSFYLCRMQMLLIGSLK